MEQQSEYPTITKIVLIDGHAILHRAFHALPPLTTKNGEVVNAVYGFISMLLRVISELKPTHLAVVFDLPQPTFRKKLFDGYQSKRPAMDDGLSGQIPHVKRVLQEMGIPMFAAEGYEADDVIGTIVNKIRGQESGVRGQEVIIVTGDRDLLQLVDESVRVYMPVRGLTESKLFGETEVVDKFGLKPSQIVDYKALMGDQSDNYPGVPGIGPKTAVSLLAKYQTLEGIYQHLDSIESEKVKNLLREHQKSAFLSKTLATIVHNAPQTIDLDLCRLKDLDTENVQLLFDEYGFRSLIARLSGNNADRKKEKAVTDTKKAAITVEQKTLF